MGDEDEDKSDGAHKTIDGVKVRDNLIFWILYTHKKNIKNLNLIWS